MTNAKHCRMMAALWFLSIPIPVFYQKDIMPFLLASCVFSVGAMILGKLEATEDAVIDALNVAAKALKEAMEAKR